MKIQKVKATNEKEAIDRVKKELGSDALILSIEKIQSRGILKIFKKPVIQVTAAYNLSSEGKKTDGKMNETTLKESDTQEQININKLAVEQVLKDKKISDQQAKIKNLESMLSVMSNRLKVSEFTSDSIRTYDNSILQIFYEELLKQGVLDSIARDILNEVMISVDNSQNLDINLVSSKVYSKIIDILGKPEPITKNENKTRYVFFIGPTGVGKTTTIAKLASSLILEENFNIGLITADTYRIAAVEQLKVYAEILDIYIEVVYEKSDFIESINSMDKKKDIVFIDTAGRSHKNTKNLLDLKELISCIEESDKFLVLSATTKYDDLVNILNTFSDIADVKIIVTKFDETTCYGSIFNICYTIGKKISYITNGQNVPDDIELMKPEKIAKALLGLEVEL